jgi:hypothetical protein
MKKNILLGLALLVVAIFIVSCAPGEAIAGQAIRGEEAVETTEIVNDHSGEVVTSEGILVTLDFSDNVNFEFNNQIYEIITGQARKGLVSVKVTDLEGNNKFSSNKVPLDETLKLDLNNDGGYDLSVYVDYSGAQEFVVSQISFDIVYEPTCVDSDGEDYNTSGSVTFSGSNGVTTTISDYCSINGVEIVEQLCDDNTYKTKSYYCVSNQVCDGGVCVLGDTSDVNCIDSDGGEDFGVYGEVIGTKPNGKEYVLPDQCYTTKKGIKLLESFCNEKGVPEWSSKVCLSGQTCQDGACI